MAFVPGRRESSAQCFNHTNIPNSTATITCQLALPNSDIAHHHLNGSIDTKQSTPTVRDTGDEPKFAAMASDQEREHALASFKAKLIESREWEAKLKNLRLEIKGLQKEFDQTEENIKALQSVGQIIGEVLKQLDEERCRSPSLCILIIGYANTNRLRYCSHC